MTERSDESTQSNARDQAESVVRGRRFSGGPARDFMSGLAADRRIFEADLAVDRAHVVMLAEQEIIDVGTAGAILEALETVEADGFDALPQAEDVHEAIETAVIDAVGPDGGRMHTARSRNDEVAACLRFRLRQDLLSAVEATTVMRHVLIDIGATHKRTVAPGYTHRQPAQPTTIGHWALSYESALARDTDRLFAAYDRTNRSPLGAAAFAGTPFDIDRDRVADLLGFDGLVHNSTDAVSTRDFLVEAVGTLANEATTLSGIAEDVIFFANRGFVTLSDDYASTSSIMPQKKNPDSMELVRARSGDAVGALSGILTTLKGLPRAYNRDLQRVTPMAWQAIDSVHPAIEVCAGALGTAEWDDQRLATAAREGFGTATGIADALAMAGVPFRTAHDAVATAAERADGEIPSADTIRTAIGEVLEGDHQVDEGRIRALLDPMTSVEDRDSAGGPAPTALDAALERAHDRLDGDESRRSDRASTLESARDRLAAEVSRYT